MNKAWMLCALLASAGCFESGDDPARDVVEVAPEVAVDAAPEPSLDVAQPGEDVGGEIPSSCPAEPPIGVAGACSDGQVCNYGQECCCGQCHPSLVCQCSGQGWGCYATDACMIPGCPDVPPAQDVPPVLDAPDVPPLPAGCCERDGDCAEGAVCRADRGDIPGKCLPDPRGPPCTGDSACCWDDRDCPSGTTCEGALACGCIELCPVCGMCAPDRMGKCVAL